MNGRIKRQEPKERLRFPKIGNIRCGMKVTKNGRTYPTSTDYFIGTGKYEKFFNDAYGDKPSVIQVVFLDDKPNLVCDERLELRDNEGKLVAYGDGLEFMVFNPKTEKYEPFLLEAHPEMLERIAEKNKGKWKTTLTLKFLVPKISNVIGYWELKTNAEASSIPEITGVFDEVLTNKGFIRGILFDLSVTMHTSNKPGVKSKYPVISLVPNHSEANKKFITNHFKIEYEKQALQGG